MSDENLRLVRIYLTEQEAHLERLLAHLHDVEGARGVTVLRAVAGFGASGVVHSARLVDLAPDLPLVVEFFDVPERVATILDALRGWLPPCPIVSWPVRDESVADGNEPT